MAAANPASRPTLDRRDMLLGGTALVAASAFGAGVTMKVARAQGASAVSAIPPSPGWGRALPPGPDARVRITEAYAQLGAANR